MIEIKRILFPTDFSRCPEQALTHAIHLTKRYQAELHILHAIVLHGYTDKNPEYGFANIESIHRWMEQEASDHMSSILESLEIDQLKIKRAQMRGPRRFLPLSTKRRFFSKWIYLASQPTQRRHPKRPGGLFGQLSILHIEVETDKQIFPEDLVETVDRHALAPVYSYLTEEDQAFIIQKVHSHKKTSVVVTDEVKEELARNRDIAWYSVRCSNFGMLRPYSTVLATEKSMWVPSSGWEQ